MVFQRVNSFSTEDMNHFSSASLVTRSTNDITQLQAFFVAALQMLLMVPILGIGGLIKILGKGKEWTGATLMILALLMVLFTWIMASLMPPDRGRRSGYSPTWLCSQPTPRKCSTR